MNDRTRLDNLPQQERKIYCYCKENQTHCGVCMECGNPGHLRSLMFVTFPWCDDCYIKALEEDTKLYK